ncbi:transposase [Streptomyces mirabilis]|uniref:transposase n=1 Tax=Streptomyces mirabilis TaxID=68239 RepID=UPI003F4B4A56
MTLIVDSQSVKGASTVGRKSRGYGAAKKINGCKRHIAVDTLGLPVMITVTPADIQDRDAEKVRGPASGRGKLVPDQEQLRHVADRRCISSGHDAPLNTSGIMSHAPG